MGDIPESSRTLNSELWSDPLGPVFISYRASDGADRAEALAWTLRSYGVPVWHDATDLPPGDTIRRLTEALAAGLSGGILLVTPEIQKSHVVREIELPRLLSLERDTSFNLAIVNTLNDVSDDDNIDLEAPDRLLNMSGRLRTFKQYPWRRPTDLDALAYQLALQRILASSRLKRPRLTIDVQTRLLPRGVRNDAGLVIRTRPPMGGHRSPPDSIWPLLRTFLGRLPDLAAQSGTQEILIQGGAHLSVAFALGAAIPLGSAWLLTVRDSSGDWSSVRDADSIGLVSEQATLQADGQKVAVAVDLVPASAPLDTFLCHVTSFAANYRGWLRIRQTGDMIPASSSAKTVGELALRIRRFAAEHHTRHVDLFLRVPFPLAVHLGRSLNTLRVGLYEWEDGGRDPVYIRAVTVASGHGPSPVLWEQQEG